MIPQQYLRVLFHPSANLFISIQHQEAKIIPMENPGSSCCVQKQTGKEQGLRLQANYLVIGLWFDSSHFQEREDRDSVPFGVFREYKCMPSHCSLPGTCDSQGNSELPRKGSVPRNKQTLLRNSIANTDFVVRKQGWSQWNWMSEQKHCKYSLFLFKLSNIWAPFSTYLTENLDL